MSTLNEGCMCGLLSRKVLMFCTKVKRKGGGRRVDIGEKKLLQVFPEGVVLVSAIFDLVHMRA